MKVYIEYIIVNNLIVNFFILYLTASLLKQKIHIVLLLTSASFGTIYAVLLPIYAVLNNFAIKISLGLLMVAIMQKYNHISEYIKNLLLFFAVTFFLGGIVFGLQNLFSNSLAKQLFAPTKLYLGALAVAMIGLTFSVKKIINQIYQKKIDFANEFDAQLFNGENSVKVCALYDSGNRLYCDGKNPIIFLDNSVVERLYFKNKPNIIKNISVQTIAGKKEMEVFVIDKLVLNYGAKSKEYYKVFAGISEQKLYEYKVILHCEMCLR
ncbi:MAG: sigma-E processing peptidase SpoIIGA [Clostridia bacterium]